MGIKTFKHIDAEFDISETSSKPVWVDMDRK